LGLAAWLPTRIVLRSTRPWCTVSSSLHRTCTERIPGVRRIFRSVAWFRSIRALIARANRFYLSFLESVSTRKRRAGAIVITYRRRPVRFSRGVLGWR
jgi:hypothetical protein